MFRRLREGLAKTGRALAGRLKAVVLGRKVTPETLDGIEEVLLSSDVGVEATAALMDRLRAANRNGELLDGGQAVPFLRAEMAAMLAGDGRDIAWAPSGPTVVLVCGVNGSGKTTSVAKLAGLLRAEGRTVVLGACDTFRAAAVEQLSTWGERVGVPVVKQATGADPAAVAFDAAEAAVARKADVLLVDTAGRLHTQANLMKELEKISRVIGRRIPGAPHEVILVLDATTGQNALSQVRIFGEAVRVSGLFLAKMDGTARGGAVFAIRREVKVPVKFIGVGEKQEDVERFDPKAFVDALFGEE
ncbi:MAG: signal recognition particle-docking protein FtsY [Planctomycetaceae bacterium]|nr:signal recognition particle-docking protein FtsY [Planctomycetota bacterium]NUN52967.1 signal recognition particle-docking protein FtsY [Planctomycetaceae bacterium]